MNEKKKRGLGDAMTLIGLALVILWFYGKWKGQH